MTDWDTLKALDTLIRFYNKGTAPDLKDPVLNAYESTKAMCDFRLGRGGVTNQDGDELAIAVALLENEEIVACLKRIKRSVEKWQRQGGRRG